MNDLWMILIGVAGGIAVSELGCFKWLICKLRRNCGDKCPKKGGKG